MNYMPNIPKPGADFTPPPAGTWPAVCYRIIDMGTQPQTYQGKPAEPKHIVMFSWELHGGEETTTKDKDGNPVPMTVHRRFTWSTSPKANLRKMLESWRGKAFVESDFGNFDIRNVLGAPCLIGVTHTEREGNTYANVTSVLKTPKGMPVVKPTFKTVLLWLHEQLFDAEEFEKLSEKLREQIKASPEYQEMVTGGGFSGDHSGGGDVEDDDEVPF